MSDALTVELQRTYRSRFLPNSEYRKAIWGLLIAHFFRRYVHSNDVVLDLGCGYGEFINQIQCGRKFAMDLNPDAATHLVSEIKFFLQDCSKPWPLEDASLDVVFTSNFLEHLPDKTSLSRTLDEVRRSLKPGGCFIALGPNIRYVGGAYWDFWDHHLPLTELALREVLSNLGFFVERCCPKFLPYRMTKGPRYPLLLLRLYLLLPLTWNIFGKQFLVVARK
jgi:SAM-dependent methyltransferase